MTVPNFDILDKTLEYIYQPPLDEKTLIKMMSPQLHLNLVHLYYGNQINKNNYAASLMLL